MADPKGGFHPLAAPILLMLSGRSGEIEQHLTQLASFINATQNALQSLRAGMETFHVELSKMAPPQPPAGPVKPVPRPGFWGPGPVQPNTSFKPVKESQHINEEEGSAVTNNER